jgi:hypothetical protein
MEKKSEEAPKVPHVIEAIGLMTELVAKHGIAKDRQNTDQKYKFRGIDDVRNALAPLMGDCKLVILPKFISRTEKERTTKSGGFALQVVVKIDFHFISRVDGSEVMVPMENEAVDYSDKATNKAISQAYKALCINTFNIPTEGEEDTDDDKKKDLRGSKRMAHPSPDACDAFVKMYLGAISEAKTTATLRDIANLHAVTMENMKNSEDEHERMMVEMCRNKHKEALDELRAKDAEAAKNRPQTVSGAKAAKGGEDGLQY